MKDWGKRVIYWAAVATAGVTLAGMVWGATDYTEVRFVMLRELRPVKEQLKQVADTTLLLRWQMLNNKRLYGGGLTTEEWREFCALSRELGYVGIPECGI